jgi:phage repressor protein C with HTH and peptisase S24 domain
MLKKETTEALAPFSISGFKQRGYAPFYSEIRVSAGQYDLSLMDNNDGPESWIKIPGITVDAWFPIIGFNMEPKIHAGDIVGVVIVHNWERVDPDKVYMVVTIYDRMIKYLQYDESEPESIWAISENKKAKNVRLHRNEIIQIYRVVWSGRLV